MKPQLQQGSGKSRVHTHMHGQSPPAEVALTDPHVCLTIS